MQESTILVIDDDAITREVLAGWCTHHGIHCTTTDSITGAEELLATTSFDLILCDVHLPGNRSLGWVRTFTTRPGAPTVVLITGNPELETTLAAANLSVGGYLLKPLDFNNLLSVVQRHLENRRRLKKLADLSQATALLLTESESNPLGIEPQLHQQLVHLLAQLQDHATLPRAIFDQPLRQSLVDAVAVLEKTKHSFRSKELGDLRRRLEQTLQSELAVA